MIDGMKKGGGRGRERERERMRTTL